MRLEKFCITDPEEINDICKATFIPTENCNIKCDYCSRGCNEIKDKYYYATDDDFRKLLKFLELQNYNHYILEFFGGEPTVHPRFREFHKILNTEYFNEGNDLIEIHTLTNLAKPFDYWTYDWPKQTKFSCSYHFGYIKDTEEWFSKINYLEEKGMLEDIKFILTPDNEKEIVKIYEKYKTDRSTIYELVVQEQLVGTEWAKNVAKKYDADYLGHYKYEEHKTMNCEILFDDGSKGDLQEFQFYDFNMMLCNCRFRISETGDVYYCWRKFDDPKAKPILNVFKDPLKKVIEWHFCQYHDCDICDIHYMKYSLAYFARHKNEIQKR